MNPSERQPLRPRAPLTPSQAALHVRPFAVGSHTIDPIHGHIIDADDSVVTIDSETMLVLVMLAADAGRTVTDRVIGATVWPTSEAPGPLAEKAVETLRGFFGTDAIERAEDGHKLTSPVSIDANDSGFWLPKPKRDDPSATGPATTTVVRIPSWNPILVMPIAAVLLLLVVFLLR